MNLLTKLGRSVNTVWYLYRESPRAANLHTGFTRSLNSNLDNTQAPLSGGESLDPFASSFVLNQPRNILQDFVSRKEIGEIALENGVSEIQLPNLFDSFVEYYSKSWREHLDVAVILSDIEKEHGHITDLFPIFLRYAYSHRLKADTSHQTETIVRTLINDYHKQFIDARRIKRKVIIHVGGTNSGKTYQAMQRYLQSESGIYAAPLRMLAHETYVRTNEEGIDCDMFTGEEKKYKNSADKPSAHVSCTVEMVPTDMSIFQVGVIDEIQMIGDDERGAGWTKALFGLCCKELHLCGHPSAVNLVKTLLKLTEEEVEVRTYDRLTPLSLSDTHLNSDFKKMRPGDCMIAFSRLKLHSLKAQIEVSTGMKCGIIYGHLPPRVRMEQIRLFNDPDSEIQVIVASDAIGLGVNLNIKRIIFNSFHKTRRGRNSELITPQLAKQIAGRAGRYLSRYPEGEVTCFHAYNYLILKKLLATPIPDIPKAILSPTSECWAHFDYLFPGNTTEHLLQLLNSKIPKESNFQFLNDSKLVSASLLKIIGIQGVSTLNLMNCFVNLKIEFIKQVSEYLLSCFAEGRLVRYEDVLYSCSWPRPPPVTAMDLEVYEHMSEVCDLYLWLHQRNPTIFPDRFKIRDLQIQISRIIGDTLCCPCFPTDREEVYYLPRSDYVERFSAYYKSALSST